MSAFLTLDAVSFSTPDGKPLVDGLTLAFGRERTGIVGRNGCGKTSLLNMMAGFAEPGSGSIMRSGTIAVLDQAWADPSISVAVGLGVADGLARLERLARGDGCASDAADADWTLEARIDAALREIGLEPAILARRIDTLSGGERTRLAIARATLTDADLLLLDEPTNNLDAEGRSLIGELVGRWHGGVVVASHDRALLEGMDRIVTLSSTGAETFGGGWSAYIAARDAARAHAAAELERTDREVRNVGRAVQQQRERKARRDKAGRAWRAKGIDNKMFLDAEKGRAERSAGRDHDLAGRLLEDAVTEQDAARRRVEVLTPLSMVLPPSRLPADRRLVAFEGVTLRRDGRRIVGPLSFEVRGPERVALAGRNGAGKTSVIGLIRGTLSPDEGSVWTIGRGIALLDQHVGLLERDESILANHRRLHPDLTEHDARAALARFAFRNRAVDQSVATLSGGERLRAGLACAMGGTTVPQLLLLDEPTNHLDADAIEALETALGSYDGAIIVASHDAGFLDAVKVDRVIRL
ncbi:ATP-binding cassette domain-containing protein [Sphingomonas adhaesiva]|uniref:ATP-binding cassette domain-containing protein n=1 Tax=Sphingomonas adhaesiva TaxID=28212 RepID=UPI002FF691EB